MEDEEELQSKLGTYDPILIELVQRAWRSQEFWRVAVFGGKPKPVEIAQEDLDLEWLS